MSGMTRLGHLWDESIELGKLVLPSVIINVLDISLFIFDLICLGHYGRDALAAGAIASAYFNMIWYFMEGVLSAQDSLTANAFGKQDQTGTRYWTYISVIVMTGMAVAGSVLLAAAPCVFLSFFALEGVSAHEAVAYTITLIPALWCQTGFRVMQKYLLVQSVLLPTVVCLVMGLMGNLLMNYVLMFALDLGSIGCAVATSLSRAGMLVALYVYFSTRETYQTMRSEFLRVLQTEFIEHFPRHNTTNEVPYCQINYKGLPSGSEGAGTKAVMESVREVEMKSVTNRSASDILVTDESAHTNVDDDATTLIKEKVALESAVDVVDFDGRSADIRMKAVHMDCLQYVALGLPAGMVLIMELWLFDLAIIVASQIGTVSISSQQIVIAITSFLFVAIPLAFSIASTVRVARLLGSQNHDAARISGFLAIGVTTVLMGICAFVLIKLRNVVGFVITSDADIVNRVKMLLPVVASFQVVNGLQGVAQGVMRGMGRHRELFAYSFLAYWIIGFPLSMYLAFFTRPRNGLYGIWYGFITGFGLLGFILMFVIYSTNWEREARRARVRAEKYQSSVDIVQSSPHPGGRAMGGFLLLSSVGEEEMDELERVEIVLYENDVAVVEQL